MEKINSPPQKEVPVMCGIDSLHLLVRCSIRELFSFVREEKLIIIEERRTRWTTELKLILAGEKIQVVASKRSLCRFEFGGLYYSENASKKLQFIRKLTQRFPEQWKIQRLDFACDIKVDYKDVRISASVQDIVYEKYSDTYYINRKTKARTYSWCIYNKAKRLEIFSFPLTRIELRLYKQTINNRALGDCFNEVDTFNKCIKTIDRFFTRLNIYIKGQHVEGLNVNARNVLENFVEFLHSDCPFVQIRDHFHIGEALIVRDKIKKWMKTENISWVALPVHCKKAQKKVCEKVGISEPTLRKAIQYAKNYEK